jgi:hypothetical protein
MYPSKLTFKFHRLSQYAIGDMSNLDCPCIVSMGPEMLNKFVMYTLKWQVMLCGTKDMC